MENLERRPEVPGGGPEMGPERNRRAGPGRPRLDFCKRGHRLSVNRTKHTTCRLCKSITRKLSYDRKKGVGTDDDAS